ncbi:MAG TPA: FAD-dependent monooxygenase [Steroidobacteraceae bacterium]|jgi:2-polyprenyl-6-methoxyphenol hydroxylase-like FAD-dependent oxidoreductase
MTKRVLISGASIAGPALAFWLSRYGFEVTVVERSPGLRPGGYAVDFRGSTMKVLERMELVPAIKQHETRTSSIVMVDEQDKVVARLPDGFTSGDLEILRGDLAKVLYETTRASADYLFDDSIHALAQSADAVEVVFASGKMETFDWVVGADGLHSNVRALAFGEESKFVRHMGYYISIFSVPDFMNLGDAGRYYVELGKRVGCFGTKNDGNAKASFYFASQRIDYDRRDVASQKKLLRETYAGVGWKTPQILQMLDAAPDFYFDSLSQVKMDRWSSGRVVLLGDSASCPSPMAGMGTSIAIIGAYVLAGELKLTPDDHSAAFARYEATMREFVAQAQQLAEGVSWFIPQTRLKLWMSKRMWSWMPQRVMRKLMIEQPSRIASIVQPKDYA